MSNKSPDAGTYDTNCPFCAIINGHEGAHILTRWNDVIAFAPQNPATRGHTLIVPTSHIDAIWDLSPSISHDLIDKVIDVTTALRAALNPDGVNIVQSNGAAATQTIRHVHFHVVPRYKDDDMGEIWPERGQVSEKETVSITAAVSEEIARHPKKRTQR